MISICPIATLVSTAAWSLSITNLARRGSWPPVWASMVHAASRIRRHNMRFGVSTSTLPQKPGPIQELTQQAATDTGSQKLPVVWTLLHPGTGALCRKRRVHRHHAAPFLGALILLTSAATIS